MEKIILRIERDPYMKINKVLVLFPEDEAWRGRICCQPMWIDGYGIAHYECYDECDYTYYLTQTKPLKDENYALRIKAALEERYGEEFKLVQKVGR